MRLGSRCSEAIGNAQARIGGMRMDQQGAAKGIGNHWTGAVSHAGALATIRGLCQRKRPEWFDLARYPALTAADKERVFKRAHRQSLNEKRRPKRKRIK